MVDRKVNEILKSIKVKEWYCVTYPDDNLGCEISSRISFLTIYNAIKSGRDIYEVMGVGDSIIRERIFDKLSIILKVDYSVLFYMWLDKSKSNK